ncbi:hypothetical protein DFH09DRAFT_1104460 [Mycena vulgaris]|nr:hypothetical protein DFH09DRAFT_1104460 [Mycena vulgaris]
MSNTKSWVRIKYMFPGGLMSGSNTTSVLEVITVLPAITMSSKFCAVSTPSFASALARVAALLRKFWVWMSTPCWKSFTLVRFFSSLASLEEGPSGLDGFVFESLLLSSDIAEDIELEEEGFAGFVFSRVDVAVFWIKSQLGMKRCHTHITPLYWPLSCPATGFLSNDTTNCVNYLPKLVNYVPPKNAISKILLWEEKWLYCATSRNTAVLTLKHVRESPKICSSIHSGLGEVEFRIKVKTIFRQKIFSLKNLKCPTSGKSGRDPRIVVVRSGSTKPQSKAGSLAFID